MARIAQPVHQRRPDQPVRTDHQHAPPARQGAVWRRAAVSGACASLLSSAVVSWLSHHHTGSASSGTNATSQWLWGAPARRKRLPNLRHTAVGYLIHHASSVFWAGFFERAALHRPSRSAALAVTTAVVAYVVDYHVVPRRLSPGFDRRMHPHHLPLAYAAFAAGLCVPRLYRHLAARIRQRLPHRHDEAGTGSRKSG